MILLLISPNLGQPGIWKHKVPFLLSCYQNNPNYAEEKTGKRRGGEIKASR